MALPDERERGFTYADYLTWSDEERWEIIDGFPYSMSPAPDTVHQYISIRLGAQLLRITENGPCTVFAAPTDVVLPDPDLSEVESDVLGTTVDLGVIWPGE